MQIRKAEGARSTAKKLDRSGGDKGNTVSNARRELMLTYRTEEREVLQPQAPGARQIEKRRALALRRKNWTALAEIKETQ